MPTVSVEFRDRSRREHWIDSTADVRREGHTLTILTKDGTTGARKHVNYPTDSGLIISWDVDR